MTEREKIAEQNHKIYCKQYEINEGKPYWTNGDYSKLSEKVKDYDRAIADFILEDRKRIVDPLVKGYLRPDFPKMSMNGQLNSLYEAVVETLTLAGVKGEKI